MILMKTQLSIIVLLSIFLGACKNYDKNFIPYGLRGMDAWVYNNENEQEYFGGRSEGNYLNRRKVLGDCQKNAHVTANEYYLKDWSYVCCTVTSSSDCVTKVR